MNSLSLPSLNNIKVSDLLKEKATRYYVCDLTHQAPPLIKEAKESGIIVCGALGRRPKNKPYIAICAGGIKSPKIYWIKLSNGSILINYSGFDTHKMNVPIEEMNRIITQIEAFEPSLNWTTSNNMLTLKLKRIVESQCELWPVEEEMYDMIYTALRGGANYIMRPQTTEPVELHIDYHQLYGYVMMTHNFPAGQPTFVSGYEDHEFAIYALQSGTKARVKADGFPIIPIGGELETGMCGGNGDWFDIGDVIQYISKPDLELLIENYEFDNDITILGTLYYKNSLSGEEYFKPTITEIYEKRKQFKGQPEERFYKIMNEVLPGRFQRTEYDGGFWRKEFRPNPTGKGGRYNPKIGIFITAYGRQLLNKLLKMFPHDKVIGFDTDCVFFAGRMEEVPEEVKQMFGELPGQVHEDGYYSNVYHKASKFYYGFDYLTGEYFQKTAGVSATGKAWKWNDAERIYELVEVKEDEERLLTF